MESTPSSRASRRLGFGALAAVLVAFVLLPLSSQAADVGSNVEPDTSNYGTNSGNIYYLYVQEGEWVHLWGNGGTGWLYRPGEDELSGTAGGTAFRGPHEVTADNAGVWTIRMGGASAWYFTVFDDDPELIAGDPREQTSASTELPGRLWTEQYDINQSGGVLKDISFWMVNDSGFLYELNLYGYNGINSTILANSTGIPVGASGSDVCTPSYRSWDHDGPNDTANNPPEMPCAVPYRLFFEEPDLDNLPISAPADPNEFNGERDEIIVMPPPQDETSLVADDFAFTPDDPNSTVAGTISYDLGPGYFGSHWVQIDVDGNGVFDDEVDREFQVGTLGEPISLEFDGLDGLGDAIEPCTELTVQVYFDRIGEVHVVQSDVEGREGIEIIRQNGPGAPDATIYWDDTQTDPDRTTLINHAEGPDGTAGVDSTGGTHGWDFATQGWGDMKHIDDWAFVEVDHVGGTLNIQNGCTDIVKSSDPEPGTTVEAGDEITYTLTFENPSSVPVEIDKIDDLSGVLDDADLVEGPSSDALDVELNGAVLEIAGELEPETIATVTYTVQVRDEVQDGDDVLANFVLNPGETPPATCVAESPWCTWHPITDRSVVEDDVVTSPPPSAEASDDLPLTGADLSPWALTIAFLLLGLGITTLWFRRYLNVASHAGVV